LSAVRHLTTSRSSIEKSYSHSRCFVCKNETFFCANRNSSDETHAKNRRHKANEYPIQQKSSLCEAKKTIESGISEEFRAMLKHKRTYTFENFFPEIQIFAFFSLFIRAFD
jgi:hypothetical protein